MIETGSEQRKERRGGGGGIRTHEPLRVTGFQDRRHRPPGHPSGVIVGASQQAPRIPEASPAPPEPGCTCAHGKARVRGVSMKGYKKRRKSLRELAQLAAGHGDKPCMVYGDTRLSYAEFFARANSVASRPTQPIGPVYQPRSKGSVARIHSSASSRGMPPTAGVG